MKTPRKTALTISLPRYVVPRPRPSGALDFYFEVPKRLRPPNWPPAIRLPIRTADRTRTGDAAEIAAVIRDAGPLNERLDREREGQVTEPRHSLDDYWVRWTGGPNPGQATKHWQALKPKTRQFYSQGWSHLAKWSARNGKPHIGRIQWKHIVKLLGVYDDRPGVHRQVRLTLQKLFEDAHDDGAIDQNPWETKKHRRWNKVGSAGASKAEKQKRTVTWDEVLQIADVCTQRGYPSMALAVVVAFDTMQYPADIISMRIGIEYNAGCWQFDRQKTGVPAVVPASKTARAMIGDNPDRLYLLIYEGTQRPYSASLFRKVWWRCIKDTPWQGFEFRWLRHSAVTEADNAGCAESEMDAMGAWKPGGSGKAVRDQHYRNQNPELARRGMAAREAYRNGPGTKESDTSVRHESDTPPPKRLKPQ